ncbi:hypothetical protein [Amycolatopsis sp. FDAARGOS 1241]|nr:hypothetical protein [Amycolatopsis sp. FDAARGOS 1241]QRP49241.1 hypothetical protein I6J71_16590 [Amycolatopsis sp. FDAARGOS 1241]
MTGAGTRVLPAGHPSLARGFVSPAGTLVVLGPAGEYWCRRVCWTR